MDASMKHPSTFVPVAMSLLALAVVIGHAAIYGIAHEADEGVAAHIFQILMAAQLPVIVFLIVTRLRREPLETLRVLAVQAAAAFAAFTAVFFLT
jgi:uncharacterized membrane protein